MRQDDKPLAWLCASAVLTVAMLCTTMLVRTCIETATCEAARR